MGQSVSSASWMTANNEVGLKLNRTYTTKHSRITTVRVHPAGDLFVAGNEEGTLLLFDFSTDTNDPRHCCTLSYEYGGVSEFCWLGADFLAVGTTRGKIITFSIRNTNKRLTEVMNVKAHGDGAAQIAVDGLDYCSTTNRLVSVAEGVGSIRLWNVNADGALAAQELPIVTTAYNTPRYVSFLGGGTQLLVAFMENSMVQIFSVNPFELTLESSVGQQDGRHEGHLGSALVLEAMERFLVLNWRFGFLMYDFQPVTVRGPRSAWLIHQSGNGVLCNQGLTSLRSGSYIASVSDRGIIQLWKAREGTPVGRLKITGRGHSISAIHASGFRDTLVAASICEDGGPTTLTVWQTEDRQMSMPHSKFSEREDKSTIKIALLCILPGSATASHPTVSITTIVVTQPTTVITSTSTVIVTPSAISIPSAPTIAPQHEEFDLVPITPGASHSAILPLLYPSDI